MTGATGCRRRAWQLGGCPRRRDLIAQLFLVEKELREGPLVRRFPQTVDMSAYTYYLLPPKHRPKSEDMTTFRLRLLEQARQTR